MIKDNYTRKYEGAVFSLITVLFTIEYITFEMLSNQSLLVLILYFLFCLISIGQIMLVKMNRPILIVSYIQAIFLFITEILFYGVNNIWLTLYLIKGFYNSKSLLVILIGGALISASVDLNTNQLKPIQTVLFQTSCILVIELISLYKSNQILNQVQETINKKLLENIITKIYDKTQTEVFSSQQTEINTIQLKTSTVEQNILISPKNDLNQLIIQQSNQECQFVYTVYSNINFQQQQSYDSDLELEKKQTYKTVKELLLSFDKYSPGNSLIIAKSYDWVGLTKIKYLVMIDNVGPANNLHYIVTHKLLSRNLLQLQNNKIIQFKARLTSIFAHKLKTPLNSAIGHLAAANEDKFIPKNVIEQYMKPALLNCRLQLFLIQDVLDYLGSESEQIQVTLSKVHLKQLLSDILECIESQCLMKNIEIKFTVNGQNIKDISKTSKQMTVYTDENKLTRILLNLLNNSYRYTNPGGWISLNLAIDENNTIQFYISDNGVGMSQEKLKVINFELNNLEQSKIAPGLFKKQQLRHDQKQLGLSLIITNKLIRLLSNDQSGLSARLHSEGGTQFTFVLASGLEVASDSSCGKKSLNAKRMQSLKNLTNMGSSKRSLFKQNESQFRTIPQTSRQNVIVQEESIVAEPTPQFPNHFGQICHLQQSPQQHKSIYRRYQVFNSSYSMESNNIRLRQKSIISKSIQESVYLNYDSVELKCAEHMSPIKTPELILIVDDEPFNHETLSLMLRGQGYSKFIRSFNGQECIDIVRSQHQDIKAIFMDIDMPIMDGLSASKILIEMMNRHQILPIPIVACTAHEDFQTHRSCFSTGMIHVVIKPIFLQSLKEALQCINEFVNRPLRSGTVSISLADRLQN